MNLEFYILQDINVPGTAGPSLFQLLREKLRLSPGWAAGVMVLVEFLLIGVPLVLAATVLVLP